MTFFAFLLFSPILLIGVDGHGALVWPPNWTDGQPIPLDQRWNKSIVGPYKDAGTGWGYNYPYSMSTDQAYISGHGNEYQSKGEVTNKNKKQCGKKCRHDKTPWSSPGKAPVYGGGCGAFGGNPDGCPANTDTKPPGSWCHDDCKGCNGWNKWTWNFGVSALDTPYPQANTTTWERGSVQTVAYNSRNGHGGGYTYRLCKLSHGNASKDERKKKSLSEECFANNILKFATNFTLTRLTGRENLGSEWRKEFKEDLTEGTNPPGSAWRPLGEYNKGPNGDGKINKDSVEVPRDIEAGEYALSWRWDAETAPQIWLSCAWIDIV